MTPLFDRIAALEAKVKVLENAIARLQPHLELLPDLVHDQKLPMNRVLAMSLVRDMPKLLEERPSGITAREVVDRYKIPMPTVRWVIGQLVDQGKLAYVRQPFERNFYLTLPGKEHERVSPEAYAKTINRTQKKILEYIKENGHDPEKCRGSVVADALKLSDNNAFYNLRMLVNKGILTRHGTPRGVGVTYKVIEGLEEPIVADFLRKPLSEIKVEPKSTRAPARVVTRSVLGDPAPGRTPWASPA